MAETATETKSESSQRPYDVTKHFSDNERITYTFGEQFIEEARIEDTLEPHTDTHISMDDSIVRFKSQNGSSCEELTLNVIGDRASFLYHRIIASSNEGLVKRADLASTLEKMATNAGFKFECCSVHGTPLKLISISGKVPVDNYRAAARLIGTAESMISLYLKDEPSA